MKFHQYPAVTSINPADVLLLSQSPVASDTTKSITSANFKKDLLMLAPESDSRNLIQPGGNIGQIVRGVQTRPLLSLEGAAPSSYRYNTLFYIDRTWSDVVDPGASRFSEVMFLNATAGGTYGNFGAHPGLGNSAHQGSRVEGYASTPTQLIGHGYLLKNYAEGDAGFAAGTTESYGYGLLRGLEHVSIQGHLQMQATLTAGSPSDTLLHYGSAINEGTLGVGRILIDIDAAYSVSTVSISRNTTTVTGAGVNFDPSVVGQYFKVNADDRSLGGATGSAWYQIAARPDAQTLTLERVYGNTSVVNGTYAICPGAEITAFDTTAKTITVKPNTVGWAAGHRVQPRISIWPVATPMKGAVARSLPYIELASGIVSVSQITMIGAETVGGSDRLGPAYAVGSGAFSSGLFLGGGDVDLEAAIVGFGANVTGPNFMTLPLTKKIRWGGGLPWIEDGEPCILVNASKDFQYEYGGTPWLTVPHTGGLQIRISTQGTHVLELNNSIGTFLSGAGIDGRFIQATVAGTPTGTPEVGTTVYDTAAHKLWIYDGGWRYLLTA